MKFGNRSKQVLIGTLGAMLISSAALAGPGQLRFTDVDVWGQASTGDVLGGGPFEVEPIGLGVIEGLGLHGAAAGRYLSFCVEINEHIGETTYNAVVNTAADNGGAGGPNPDPLDERTAFLYTAFLKGQLAEKLALSGFDIFNYESGLSGRAMQEAVWVLEEELDIGVASDLAADMVELATAAVTEEGEWFGRGIGNVRILNLTHRYTGGSRQDQLVMIPLPLPVLLGLAGLVGIGVSRRWGRNGGGDLSEN